MIQTFYIIWFTSFVCRIITSPRPGQTNQWLTVCEEAVGRTENFENVNLPFMECNTVNHVAGT